MTHSRLIINGFTFMGRSRIPQDIGSIALTDRGTGTLYWLKMDTAGTDFVTILTPLPTLFDGIIYPAFEGPQIWINVNPVRYFLRLLVRDSFFGYEVVEDGRTVGNKRILVADVQDAKPLTDNLHEIFKPAGIYSPGGTLAYERRTTF